MDRKMATFGLEGSMRSIFTNANVCACNFQGSSVPAVLSNSTINLPAGINGYSNPTCVAPIIPIAVPGMSMTPGLSISSVKMVNANNFGSSGTQLMGDLEVKYTTTNGVQIAPSTLKDVVINYDNTTHLAIDCAGALANASTTAPSICGINTVCWQGHTIVFHNGFFQVSSILDSFDTTSFVVRFSVASGRTLLMKFSKPGATLVATRINGWANQLCFSHQMGSPPCGAVTVGSLNMSNCGATITWTSDIGAGDTLNTGYGTIACGVSNNWQTWGSRPAGT
jgi:hypothetical protein